ncbi:hypothetical protein MRS44_018689 [Fusarium solani]|uniref:uncharacterized protein n=1 Tax=Fusarium solani TaxID=169388 RepID=UPI0032C42109|nr:hypothetical protein MRS44_018689 [Fusarium solani]
MLLLLLVQTVHLACDSVFSFLSVAIASVGGFDASTTYVNHERVSANRECADWSDHSCFSGGADDVEALSDPKALANYGARKEGTFRLDTILTMLNRGFFDPDRSPHVGPVSWPIPLRHGSGEDDDDHYPFWVVPTSDINGLIFTQAARFVLPLDHLFQEAPLASSSAGSAKSSIRQILSYYTAQLFCRFLLLAFSSEREVNHDKLSEWRVRGQRGSVKERRGLGLEESIDKSGMLWIPRDRIDWRRGYIALTTLIHIYIPRSPFQAPLASQANIQELTTTQLTVEFYLQEWVRDARQAFDGGREDEDRQLALRIVRLSAEEIARAYNQQLLAKIQSYWERVRGNLGRGVLPALAQLEQARRDAAAERSRIVTAQTILEIYMEAWAVYTAAAASSSSGDIHQGEQMPSEIPCWVKTRKYRPPKDTWFDFVFELLLGRSNPPTWKRVYFLQVYRTFKAFWETISESAGSFDAHLRRTLGSYIMVTFNSDQNKEVGTNNTRGTWCHGKPPFFQMQYWAPYFAPPKSNRHIRLGSASQDSPYFRCTPSEESPRVLTTREFQDLEKTVHQNWLHFTIQPDQPRHEVDQQATERHCRRALRRVALLSGPTWGSRGRLEHVVPWRLRGGEDGRYGDMGAFHVPIPASVVSRDGPDTLSSDPTIMLPTQHNVMESIKAFRSIPGLSRQLIQQLQRVKHQLRRKGSRFDIPSHLEAKKEAGELMPQSRSLMRQFLSQRGPPEWLIEPEDTDGIDTESEVYESDETDTGTDVESDGDTDLFGELETLY